MSNLHIEIRPRYEQLFQALGIDVDNTQIIDKYEPETNLALNKLLSLMAYYIFTVDLGTYKTLVEDIDIGDDMEYICSALYSGSYEIQFEQSIPDHILQNLISLTQLPELSERVKALHLIEQQNIQRLIKGVLQIMVHQERLITGYITDDESWLKEDLHLQMALTTSLQSITERKVIFGPEGPMLVTKSGLESALRNRRSHLQALDLMSPLKDLPIPEAILTGLQALTELTLNNGLTQLDIDQMETIMSSLFKGKYRTSGNINDDIDTYILKVSEPRYSRAVRKLSYPYNDYVISYIEACRDALHDSIHAIYYNGLSDFDISAYELSYWKSNTVLKLTIHERYNTLVVSI